MISRSAGILPAIVCQLGCCDKEHPCLLAQRWAGRMPALRKDRFLIKRSGALYHHIKKTRVNLSDLGRQQCR